MINQARARRRREFLLHSAARTLYRADAELAAPGESGPTGDALARHAVQQAEARPSGAPATREPGRH
jgi:hypothetical protein